MPSQALASVPAARSREALYCQVMLDAGAVVVAGGFGIDTNVYVTGGRMGAEMTFARTSDGLGQAGCYSVLAAAALGVPTRAVAALGQDRLGAWIREDLRARGIQVTELRDPVGTHRSINLVAADGSRRNYFDARGAALVEIDVAACRAALRGARVLHCHLDDWCRRLLPLACDEGLLISCDLQDLIDIDDPYRADFANAADVVFISAANLADPAAAASELARRRAGRIVVVGAGAAGCLVVHGDDVQRYPAVVLEAPVVDTNGAGDTMAVTFLVAHLLDGLSVERAIGRAQLAARVICSQRGDVKAPLSRAQLDALEATRSSPAARSNPNEGR
jgi:acarbose 7IV-phosphotransferase